MFCPNAVFISPRPTSRTGLVFAMGNVAVEYDIPCPHCGQPWPGM